MSITNDLAQAYADGYKQGIKDFAKCLIDKAKDGNVPVSELTDIAIDWSENNARKTD